MFDTVLIMLKTLVMNLLFYQESYFHTDDIWTYFFSCLPSFEFCSYYDFIKNMHGILTNDMEDVLNSIRYI